jgi:excisionase family DNA binding protein
MGQETEKIAFTCRETAGAVGISVPMVRKLVRLGKLEAVKIGRCVRIPASEIKRLVKSGTR